MKKKSAVQTAHEVFGLTKHQIRAQEGPGAQEAPGQEPEHAQVSEEVAHLFKTTYDEKGPDGLVALTYSSQTPEVQAAMKEMLESDPDGTIEMMVEALTASPEACEAWLAFTSELAGDAEVGEQPAPAEAPAQHETADQGDLPVCEDCGEAGNSACLCNGGTGCQEHGEEEEPEFKVGEAIEPVNTHGMSTGAPVMVSGIKAGLYLRGYGQSALGEFRAVEANYRRVGEKFTGRQMAAARKLVGSKTIDAVLAKRRERAQSDQVEGIADYLCNSLEHASDSVAISELTAEFQVTDAQAQALVALGHKVATQPGMMSDELHPMIEDVLTGKTAQSDEQEALKFQDEVVDKIQQILPTETEFQSSDWDGTTLSLWFGPFQESQLAAFVDGIKQHLGQEASVFPDEHDWIRVDLVAKHHQARKIAVDATTQSYFVAYFGAYGSQLTRPLAFAKSAKKAGLVQSPGYTRQGEAARRSLRQGQLGEFEKSYSLLLACSHAAQRMPADAKTMEEKNGGVVATFSTDDEAAKFAKFVGKFVEKEHGIKADVKEELGEGLTPSVSIWETGRTAGKTARRKNAEFAPSNGLVAEHTVGEHKVSIHRMGSWGDDINPKEAFFAVTDSRQASRGASAEEVLAKEKARLAKTAQASDQLKVDDICWHPQFGTCKVTAFDEPRGLVQVKWPENSSSQAYWSLVEPGTLTKQAKTARKVAQNDRSEGPDASTKHEPFTWADQTDGSAIGDYKGYTFRLKFAPGDQVQVFTGEHINPSLLDIFDGSNNHIGQAPTIEEAEKFLKEQVDSGKLADKTAQNLDSTVKAGVDKTLEELLQSNPGMSIAEAATKYLAAKEGWWKQTPEGEYLMSLVNGGKQAQSAIPMHHYRVDKEKAGSAEYSDKDFESGPLVLEVKAVMDSIPKTDLGYTATLGAELSLNITDRKANIETSYTVKGSQKDLEDLRRLLGV